MRERLRGKVNDAAMAVACSFSSQLAYMTHSCGKSGYKKPAGVTMVHHEVDEAV